MSEGVCVERPVLTNETEARLLSPPSPHQILLSVNLQQCVGGKSPLAGIDNFFLFKRVGENKVGGGGGLVVNSAPGCSVASGASTMHPQEDVESVTSEEDNCRKKRCTDRYDSSESSDSGVVVHCGDCGSSNSDITEPCSPLSTVSLEEMPPTQSQPSWLWGSEAGPGDPPSKRPKQGKITEYFKTKSKKVSDKTTVKQLFSKLLSSPSPSPVLFGEDSSLSPAVKTPPTPPTSSEDSSSSDLKLALDNGDVSLLFRKSSSLSSESPETASEERTIRFPVKNGWKGHYVSDVVCKWAECEAKFATTTALIEHLQVKHVNTQTMDENYVCRWINCKVFGRTSCSRTWLERHVLSHGGNKPYRCIVDDCGQRFSSQTLLQRHVNSHFSENKDQGSSKKSCETSSKLIRRNGKKLRYRSHPFSARKYDYFDAGMMEILQHNLLDMTERRTQGLVETCPEDTVALHSKVLGKRTDVDGQTKVLLRWYPNDILTDEWVELEKVSRVRYVSIPTLPVATKDFLSAYLVKSQRLRRCHGRKNKHTHTAMCSST